MIMPRGLGAAVLMVAAFVAPARAGRGETEYEWHAVSAASGQLATVHEQIRDRVLPALGRHGLTGVGVFVPAGDNAERIVHVVVAGDASTTATSDHGRLGGMEEWRALFAETDGVVPATGERPVRRLCTTSWSPLPAGGPGQPARIFELRTYTAPDAAKRAALLQRFEHHTLKLFEKHGMTNVIYWVPTASPDADTTLLYLLAHADVDAAKASFAAFRQDPAWTAARTASEAAAGGPLTIKDKGVVSEFLEPTAYSPLR